MKQYKQMIVGAKVLDTDPAGLFLSEIYDRLFLLTKELGRYPYWSEVAGCHIINLHWAGVIDAALDSLIRSRLVNEVEGGAA